MSQFRIALANIRHPDTPAESVTLAEQAIAQAFMAYVLSPPGEQVLKAAGFAAP